MRMIERDDALIDYSANIDMLDLRNKLYGAIIKESASIKTEDFNSFNITGQSIYFRSDFMYYNFDVYHYNLNKGQYLDNKEQIFISNYDRYEWDSGVVVFRKRYDFFK